MAKTTTTVYSCDGCSKEVERKDLRIFYIEERKMSGESVCEIKSELCTSCEETLHVTVRSLWPSDEAERMEVIIRP